MPPNRPTASQGPPSRPGSSTPCAPIARSCKAAITTKILALVDAADYRLEGDRQVLANVELRLEKTAAMLSTLTDEMSQDLDRFRRRVRAACGAEGDSRREPVFRGFTPQEAALYQEYCRIRLRESVHRCLLDRAGDVQATVKHLAAKLTALDCHLQDMDDLLSQADAKPSADGDAETSMAGSPDPGNCPNLADRAKPGPRKMGLSPWAMRRPAWRFSRRRLKTACGPILGCGRRACWAAAARH